MKILDTLKSIKDNLIPKAAQVQCVKISYQCYNPKGFGADVSYGNVCFTAHSIKELGNMTQGMIIDFIHGYFKNWEGFGHCQLLKIDVDFTSKTEQGEGLMKKLAKLEGGIYPMIGMPQAA